MPRMIVRDVIAELQKYGQKRQTNVFSVPGLCVDRIVYGDGIGKESDLYVLVNTSIDKK